MKKRMKKGVINHLARRKKILIVYYSRTGNTEKVASVLAKHLNAKKEKILDSENRGGFRGYLKSGAEAAWKSLPAIQLSRKKLENYDIIVIGTPVWSWNMASPVRTYLTMNKFKFKQTAFFCTMGGSGSKMAFNSMQKLAGKPISTLELNAKEVSKINHSAKLKEFIQKLKKAREV